MRFHNSPNGVFLYESLLDLLSHQERHNNLIVEAVFNELVKEVMRDEARTQDYSQVDLLRSALDEVALSLSKELNRGDTEFDLDPYIKNCAARLKYVSREIMALARSDVLRANQDLGELLVNAQGVPYRLHYLSIGMYFNGIYGFSVDGETFDMGQLQQTYQIEAKRFPCEVTLGSLLFIVDFSSILINLNGCTEDQRTLAKFKLTEIIDTLRPD